MVNELINNINGEKLSLTNIKNLWKSHIQEYWINAADDKEWQMFDLKLDIVGDETLNADCDVTDHYVESNTAYQDQIALKPKIYTITGEIGELVWYQRNPVSQTLGQVAQKLEGVISFLPIRSRSFNQMKNTVMKASQWVDTASNAVQKLSSLTRGVVGTFTQDGEEKNIEGALSRQAQAYLILLSYRDNRIPLSIRTPWGILKSYVITNLELKQPKESKDKSLINITFKEFRTTSIRTVPFDSKKYQGNAAFENQPKTEQGVSSGAVASISEPVTSGDKVYELLGSEISGTAEKAVITVNVTDGQENFTWYHVTDPKYSTNNYIFGENGRVVKGEEYNAIAKTGVNEMKRRIDEATIGFIGNGQ